VVSERLDHLRAMRTAVTEALAGETVTQGVYTSQWFVGARGSKMRDVKQDELDVSETAQVIWATRQMVDEAMDVPPIDVLILAVPVADAEQIVGRACRWCFPQVEKCQRLCAWRSGTCQGKPDPVIIDLRDPLVPKAAGKWRKRRRLYEEMGIKVEGKV
jgi:superfamily II DNA or RNA helicase